MEFDFEPRTLLVTGIMWAVIMLGLWKFQFGEGWSMMNRIILSILSLPIVYFITLWQLNR